MVAAVVQEVMRPLLQSIGEMLRQNSEAVERIAAAQQMTAERIAALERQVRLQTPLSRAQQRYVAEAIRDRARALLEGKNLADDRPAVNRLSARIRKSVLTRYGVSAVGECPAYDYETILSQIGMWHDALAIRDVARGAAERQGEALRG